VIGLRDKRTTSTRRRRLPAPAVVGLAWLAGSVPFSNVAARSRAQVDLRDVGNGTVSGTALYDVAGFGPLAVAGVCDIAKGFVGPVLAGPDRPILGAVAGTAGVAGHNWSPWLQGAGGRGLSVAFGAFTPLAWPGTVVLAAGLAAGRLRRHSGLGSFLGSLAVVPVVARTHGRPGAVAGTGIVSVMLAKRVLGNRPPDDPSLRTYAHRLVFDCDPPSRASAGARTGVEATSGDGDGPGESGARARVSVPAEPTDGEPVPSGGSA
jgi:acyl phosphate:glycerol-3-phosphate acyltransferase